MRATVLAIVLGLVLGAAIALRIVHQDPPRVRDEMVSKTRSLRWVGCTKSGSCTPDIHRVPDGTYRFLACSTSGWCGLMSYDYVEAEEEWQTSRAHAAWKHR